MKHRKHRKATASSVSRLLGATPGFHRSTSYASRIRGLRNQRSGFEVFNDERGVIVAHRIGWTSMASVEKREKRVRDRIEAYAEVLREHYDVTSYGNHLLVREKGE